MASQPEEHTQEDIDEWVPNAQPVDCNEQGNNHPRQKHGTFTIPRFVKRTAPVRLIVRGLESGAKAWLAKIHYQGKSA